MGAAEFSVLFSERFTCDGEHHASSLVADGAARDALVASSISRADVLHLQKALRADVELAALCHLYAILKSMRLNLTL